MNGSLSLSANFVREDAFKLAPAVFYQPENIVLGQYGFVPWVRTGLSAAITQPAGDELRGTVKVSAKLQASDGSLPELPVEKTLTLRGPADIIGIDPSQIIRREPMPGTVDAEETFLVHIEFDRPELPWLFSPYAPVGNTLRPWLALVVCDTGNAEIIPGSPGLPQILVTVLGELPSLTDAASWAHAQVVGAENSPDGATVADRLSDAHAPANLSRLLCPRKLEPNRNYIACLVPAFDCGVQAGLGKSGGTLDPAWVRVQDGSDAANQIVLPIYDSWTFRTGPAGDFRSLAEKLEGITAPWQVGRRIIDVSHPGHGISPLSTNDAGAVQVLRCALVSLQPVPEDGPKEDVGWDVGKRDELRQQVDAANEPGHEDLPRVGPRLYARFQRGQSKIGNIFGEPPSSTVAADSDWFTELNTDPMHRIVAGLGTRVIQKDQENLMQAAWAQVGDIEKANNELKRHQFGRYVGEAIHRMHLSKLDTGTLAQIMRGVQGKIRTDSGALTVYGSINESRTAPVAMTAAFRRATRLRGPLARLNTGFEQKTMHGIIADSQGFKDFRRPYSNPDGVGTLSTAAINAIPSALLAKKLGVTEALSATTLSSQLAVTASLTVADSMLAPVAAWSIPAGKIDLGTLVADSINTKVTELMPSDVTQQPAVSEPLSALLVGLANSGIDKVAVNATRQVQNLDKKLIFSAGPAVSLTTAVTGIRGVTSTPVVAAPALVARSIDRSVSAVSLKKTAISGTAIGTVLTPVHEPIVIKPSEVKVPTALSRFETSVSRALVTDINQIRAVPYMDFAAALSEITLANGLTSLPLTPDRPILNLTQTTLLQAVDPGKTMAQYVKGRIAKMPTWLAQDWFNDFRIEPIMAAPHFTRPMYEALDSYDRDWLVPGLGSIVETDFVTLLKTNPVFTESFLIGLSDEMGRELLWRGYPTDQRGTYFRRFWNHDSDELASEIHTFSSNPQPQRLGTHLNDKNDEGYLVFVVRGALVRRYPHAIVAAVLAESAGNERPAFTTKTAEHLFHIHLAPDYLLVGFKLTAAQMNSEPWWFIIAEHPTAPRFGLAFAGSGNVRANTRTIVHDAVDWNDLTPEATAQLEFGRFLTPRGRTVPITNPSGKQPNNITWPGDAGIIATTLLRNPVRAAFRGRDLITKIKSPRGPNA